MARAPNPLRLSLIAAGVMLAGITTSAHAATTMVADNDSSRSVGAAIDDTAITAKVKAKFLTDDRLKGADISVETDNGIVKLTGKAPNEKAKDAAESLAENVSGVKDVDNEISAPSALTSLKKSAGKAADDVGEAASDTWITTKVKTSIATDSKIKGDISVSTDKGVVVLSGKVPNDTSRDRAVALAKTVDGVKDVNDDGLKVGG